MCDQWLLTLKRKDKSKKATDVDRMVNQLVDPRSLCGTLLIISTSVLSVPTLINYSQNFADCGVNKQLKIVIYQHLECL